MNWYIGQEIVCIRTHSQRKVIYGKTYVIKGLRETSCKCNYVLIDIGIRISFSKSFCYRCGDLNFADSIGYFNEILFAPLDQDISELTEILEQPIKQIQEL